MVSYYTKGALIACALDLTLRREGRTTLDELMRALWDRHGRHGIGVPEDGIPALASGLAGRDLSDFFARYVEGTEDPPLRELLADFGVTLHLRAANDAQDRGGKPAKDAAPRCTLGIRLGGDQKLAVVLNNGPAAQAGLAAGDTIVAVAGLKASPERIATLLTQGAPGDVVAIHAFRRDELLEVSATLAEAPPDTCYFTLDPAPPPEVAARRDAWLQGKAKA